MATFTGTAGADTITPASRSAVVTVAGTPADLSGNDVLNGLAGDDLLDGGIGNDTLNGGTGGPNGDRLFGNVGDDVLSVVPSGLGTRIDGGIGTDRLVVNVAPTPTDPLGLVDFSRATIVAVEQLATLAGTSRLTTAQLNGFTTLLPSGTTQAVRVALADTAQAVDLSGNLATGLASLTVYGRGSGGSASIRVDPLYLGRFDYVGDTVVATRDTVTGGSGSNRLSGGAGDDLLIAGRGSDTFNGGAGNDTVSYAGSTSGVTVLMAFTTPQNTGAGTDTLVSVENLTRVEGDDARFAHPSGRSRSGRCVGIHGAARSGRRSAERRAIRNSASARHRDADERSPRSGRPTQKRPSRRSPLQPNPTASVKSGIVPSGQKQPLRRIQRTPEGYSCGATVAICAQRRMR